MSFNAFQQALQDFSQAVASCFPTLMIKRSPSVFVNQPMQVVVQAANVLQQSMIGGGGGSGTPIAVATGTMLNISASTGPSTIYTTPNDGVNHTYLFTATCTTNTPGVGTMGSRVIFSLPGGNLSTVQVAAVTNITANAASCGSVGIVTAPNTTVGWYMDIPSAGGSADFYSALVLLN